MAQIPKQPDDNRGAAPGEFGNKPHERDEQAAKLIEMLAGFGLSQPEIKQAVEAQFDQGFSVATLDRHYRAELDRGLARAKSQLLQRAHQMAMGREAPQGVSPDKVYEISSKKVDFLLRVVHGVGAAELGSGTVSIMITPDDEDL